MVDLSISIVNWNTRDCLEKCLRSIYENTRDITFEVIVVDNNSDDGSAEMVNSKFANVALIENKENVGFGAANNQGIEMSKGRHILILNPDTIILRSCLDRMVEFLDNHPDVGAVGPRISNPDGTFQLSCIRNIPTLLSEVFELTYLNRKFPRNRMIGEYYMSYCDPKLAREVSLLSGCCFMIKRTVLDEVGLFDEDFFIYAEDMDLSYRITKGGWKCWYLPNAEIIHFGGESTRQIPDERVFYGRQAKYVFFKKHFGTVRAFQYRLVTLCAAMCVYLGYCLIYPLSSKESKRKLDNIISENHKILRWVFTG